MLHNLNSYSRSKISEEWVMGQDGHVAGCLWSWPERKIGSEPIFWTQQLDGFSIQFLNGNLFIHVDNFLSEIRNQKIYTEKIFGTQHLTNLLLGFVIWKSEIGDVGDGDYWILMAMVIVTVMVTVMVMWRQIAGGTKWPRVRSMVWEERTVSFLISQASHPCHPMHFFSTKKIKLKESQTPFREKSCLFENI